MSDTPGKKDDVRAVVKEDAHMNEQGTQKLLNAIEQVRDEARERDQKTDERFDRADARFERVEGTLQHLGTEVSRHSKALSDISEAQVATARAASAAAEISARALARVDTTQDDARKMVESAMLIHQTSIAAAVAEGVGPLGAKVETLKVDVKRSNEAVGAIVNELGLEDRVELGRKVSPGEHPPERALQKIDRRARASTVVQFVIAIGIIIEALWRVAGKH